MAKNGKTTTSGSKKSQAEIPGLNIESVKTVMVELEDFVSNTAQSRGMGIFSKLGEEGYDVFDKKGGKKKSIWNMLHSTSEEERTAATNLLEEHEGEETEDRQKKVGGGDSLMTMAKNLRENPAGLLQPIGAWDTGDGMDCIWGMRRLLAFAINKALYPEEEVWGKIETRVFQFKDEPSPLALRLLARSENEVRKRESPVDRALSYRQDMKDGKFSIAQYAKIIGKSEQYVSDHVNRLLSKFLEDDLHKVHSGEWTMDKALKVFRKRKAEADGGKGGSERENGEGRDHWPSVKATLKLYDAGKKPAEMEQEEWEIWTSPDVRKLISLLFHVPYSEWEPREEPEPEPEEKKEPESKNGDGEGKVVKIKRNRAKLLLIALGKTDARTWDDDKIKEKLESIPNLVEDESSPLEDAGLEKLKQRLLEAYKEDLVVEIIKDDKEEKGKVSKGAKKARATV